MLIAPPLHGSSPRATSRLWSIFLDIAHVACTLPVLMQFQSASNQNGETVVDAREISIRYLKAWFTIDFLSTVPIDKLVRDG